MDSRLRYSSDKVAIVRAARERGMSDADILTAACRGEVAGARRKIVTEWAPALGLTTEEALSVARKAAIIR